MEGAGRRRARPRLRGAVRERADRRRVELRRSGHTRLPDRPVQSRHGAVARSRRGARRGERRGGADRSRMPRGGVGDATGTVPEPFPRPHPVPGAKTPACPSRSKRSRRSSIRRSTGPATACIARPRKRTPPKYASCRGATRRSPRRSRQRPRPGSKPSPPPLRRFAPTRGRGPRAAIAPCRRPAGNSRLREQRGGAPIREGTFPGYAAEALRERVGSSADPQDQARSKTSSLPAPLPPSGRFPAWIESSGSRESGPKNPSRSLWATGAPPPVLASR